MFWDKSINDFDMKINYFKCQPMLPNTKKITI